MKALLTTLMFALVLAPFAAAAQKPAAKSMKATGTVVSATDSSLVVSSGKTKKETTYVLNMDTKRDGTPTPGAKVTVQYRMEGKDRVATMVQASPAGGATAASTGTGAKTGAKSGAKKPKSGY